MIIQSLVLFGSIDVDTLDSFNGEIPEEIKVLHDPYKGDFLGIGLPISLIQFEDLYAEIDLLQHKEQIQQIRRIFSTYGLPAPKLWHVLI